MIRRVLAWLVRPQCSVLYVASWFLLGTLGTWGFVWWTQLIAAAAIGVTYSVVRDLIDWFLRRKARQA